MEIHDDTSHVTTRSRGRSSPRLPSARVHGPASLGVVCTHISGTTGGLLHPTALRAQALRRRTRGRTRGQTVANKHARAACAGTIPAPTPREQRVPTRAVPHLPQMMFTAQRQPTYAHAAKRAQVTGYLGAHTANSFVLGDLRRSPRTMHSPQRAGRPGDGDAGMRRSPPRPYAPKP